MKSKRLQTRNLPKSDPKKDVLLHVKPTFVLFFLLMVGFVMLFFKPFLLLTGLSIIILSVFCLIVMPDRNLMKFSNDYVVLFNRKDKNECTVLYYNEIVSWQYEWHSNYDVVNFVLLDGTIESQQMYSLRPVKKYMEQHAPGKMKKSIWVRKENA